MPGFPNFITLAIYGAIGVAALFAAHAAWSGFKDHIGAPYTQAQMQADQTKVDAAVKAREAAEAERDHAKADTVSCVAMVEVQNDTIAKWKANADRNAVAAKQAKTEAQARATAAAPMIAELQRAAAAKPALMACDQELSRTKTILREALAARRVQPANPMPGAK